MNELLAEGLQLMLVGMGTVFAFLTLLVFATHAMSRLVQHLFPASPISDTDEDHVAAITAAIKLHRERKNS